jgi:hypothetical protein
MRFLCLCPTYNRPWRLLEESLACFHSQVHKDAFLLIYDDLGVFPEQRHDNWALISTTTREPGNVEKYNRMLELAQEFGPFDAIALWDDDDIYLRIHLYNHSQVLKDHELSYPSRVYSTYTGERLIEPSGGRFWASLAIRYDAFERTGGFMRTRRADFDQQSLGHGCGNVQMEILITSASQPISFDGVIRGVGIVKHHPPTSIGTTFMQDEKSGSASQLSCTKRNTTNPMIWAEIRIPSIEASFIRFGLHRVSSK